MKAKNTPLHVGCFRLLLLLFFISHVLFTTRFDEQMREKIKNNTKKTKEEQNSNWFNKPGRFSLISSRKSALLEPFFSEHVDSFKPVFTISLRLIFPS